MLLHFSVCSITLSSLEKQKQNEEKIFQSHESGFGAKRVKSEKYKAINKALKCGYYFYVVETY